MNASCGPVEPAVVVGFPAAPPADTGGEVPVVVVLVVDGGAALRVDARRVVSVR